MFSELDEYDKIKSIVNRFVESVKRGDSSIMQPLFHKDAVLFGKFNEGSIDKAFAGIDAVGVAAENYSARIDVIALEKTVAVVRLIENNWNGCNLINFFTLSKQGDTWKIISVAYDVSTERKDS